MTSLRLTRHIAIATTVPLALLGTLVVLPTATAADAASACGDPATLIHQIQGSGLAFDPAYGGERTVEGVVVDVVSGGMHVQEEPTNHDADPTTSEGIFVFLGGQAAAPVNSTIRVTGTVTEFGVAPSTITELTSISFQTCLSGPLAPNPTDVTFPVASAAGLEAYESMLVRFPQDLVISEYFNYDRFGEVVAGVPPNGWDRFYTPTSVIEPGPQSQVLAADYAARRITIDDRVSAQNPSVIPHPGNGLPFSLDNRFRGGDTLTGIEGVVENSFGVYRLQPTTYGDYAAVNPRPTGVPDVGGSVQVASANVLNYFLTVDSGPDVCGPARDQECRGADNAGELERQRDKIIAELSGLDADVIGLMEMENTPGVEPAADLVAGLNDVEGPGTYDYIDTGVIGTDAIRVGLIYRPAVVQPVGDFAILDGSVDARFEAGNRPMVSQTFDDVPTGARVTISVNHLKSKGSACPGDPDTGDGQGNCNLTRVAAAEAIVDFLAADPTRSGDPDHLVIGDLNSYDHEDPIDALKAGGFRDQLRRFQGERAYSYVFDGQNGYLDHALANASLAGQVSGAAERHLNADEPDVFDYDTAFKPPAIQALYEPNAFRSSDHDPVAVGLDLTPAPKPRCYVGQQVLSYDPGLRADGTQLPPALRQPDRALSRPDGRSVSLGLGGEIVLEFAHPIQNNNGDAPDLRVVDRFDWAKGRHDSAMVSASYDGVTWVTLGGIQRTGDLDLGALSAARSIMVQDTTAGRLRRVTDGYDLDAVRVWTGCA